MALAPALLAWTPGIGRAALRVCHAAACGAASGMCGDSDTDPYFRASSLPKTSPSHVQMDCMHFFPFITRQAELLRLASTLLLLCDSRMRIPSESNNPHAGSQRPWLQRATSSTGCRTHCQRLRTAAVTVTWAHEKLAQSVAAALPT